MPLLATTAFAETVFTVDSDLDEVDANLADGKCETAAMQCTLRAAVMQANLIDGIGATIELPAGTYFLGPPVTIAPDVTGDLNLTSPAVNADPVISIVGAGSATTIIDGKGTDRILDVAARRHVVVSGVWLRNGLATLSQGGAIRNLGYLTMSDSIISDSTASGSGGGIYSEGSLILTRLTIRYNKSSGFGGGIESPGPISLSQSHLYGNMAASYGGGLSVSGGAIAAPSSVDSTAIEGNQSNQGGGIYNGIGSTLVLARSLLAGNTGKNGGGCFNAGTLFMSNSTIDQNAATTNGGGIYNQASINAYNQTIAFNEADSDADSVGGGAGIYNVAGATFNLQNSVVAGNYLAGQPDYNDCIGIVGIYGNNKFWNTAGCSAAPGSPGTMYLLASLDELDILADNGGPTRTNALLPPSSLIAGATGCTDQNGLQLKTDQRGKPRPPGARCDIGAFEYNEIFVAGFEGL